MRERRVKAYKTCPIDGCDWQLITEWFDGSPDNILVVPQADQEAAAGLHMKSHYTPERTYFT
ncbi:hypothetical protein [Rhodococcus pyridinivorans]|uniref:hypothetical protein n=1 Tax=Rhodococcus pyridinivorans TaxID=103816 RepID=UPI003AB0004E